MQMSEAARLGAQLALEGERVYRVVPGERRNRVIWWIVFERVGVGA